MSRKFKLRDVQAGRDVIMGDQVNQADLSRVETLLAEMVVLLRQPQTSVRVGQDAGHPVIIIGSGNIVGAGNELCFQAADLGLLGVLQRGADPLRREEIYLARFILGETYARWDHGYLPLAGNLVETSLRLTDLADQGLSPAGVLLEDVRQALVGFNKTRLVVLGEPGAGKTTTLHRLALDLARERMRDRLHGKLPFRADLFKFTDERQPSDFLRLEWETGGLSETYGEAVAQGKVCFLLDGVNQMPTADRARRIERWAHWANDELPPGNWAVFTCRSADYVADLRVPQVRVQNLDPARMRQYLELRFGADRAAGLWREFERRLHAGDDRFERLARNPFMLSLLADGCEQGGAIVENRAVLMDGLAYRLIEHELREGRQPETLTADPRGVLQAELEALSRLAFAMQARGEGTGLTHAAAAQVALGDKGQVRLTLDEVLDLAMDATVLEGSEAGGRGRTYAFCHHLLQEYFAARELLRQFRAGKNLARYWRAPWQTWQLMSRPLRPGERLPPPPVTGWEETVIMAVGLAGKDAVRLAERVQKDNLPLAARCVAEAGAGREDLKALAGRLRPALLERQRSSAAHLRARLAAGLALGEIGHPDLEPRAFEFEGRVVWAILPPLQAVPAGAFMRGSDRADKRAFADEYTSERRVTLPAFSIGRYPVTNAEYRFFIEAGGYQDDRWWSEAGSAWKQGGPEAHADAMQDWLRVVEWLKGRDIDRLGRERSWRPQELGYWKEMVQLSEDEAKDRARQVFERPFDRPALWDAIDFNNPGQPVVGVNWYEAAAYCGWLSAVTGQAFRLATELELEKSARGGSAEGVCAAREYPWGDKFDPSRCNTIESHIYTTTPVGLYLTGVSPYGLFDAAGNVWEWTGDWYQMYPGGDASDDFGTRFRVVRGGAWGDDRMSARCAFRFWDVPVYWFNNVGFRVVFPGFISAF